MVIGGNVVISDAAFWQHCSYDEFIGVAIRWDALANDVFVEARAILDAENAANRAGNRTDCAADHCTDRAGVVATLRRAFLRAADGALRLCRHRQSQAGKQYY
jgi:hypothetical protein